MDGKPCGVRRERLSAIRTCCLSDGIGLAGVRHAFVRILRIPQPETET
jgi:hypothetical protein